ncbi:MAG: NAD-dependent epimerase/dehydratase family protein [Deltaproteobacteria bacterium]|nr:NAD-dependent epimerase/dehydratase family protein [Deltaproteobacteria bacterium]
MSDDARFPIPSPVLVTGGAGFIGSHLVEALVGRGLRVRVVDDLSGGRLSNLAGVMGQIEFHEGDIRDRALVRGLLAGVGAVFHLAGMSSVPQSQADPSLCLDVNGQGTLNVLELSALAGVGRLIFASSSAVYGDLPAPHREDMAPSPDTPYAALKLLGEHLGHYFRGAMGLMTISLRFFNVYGPRQSADGADAGVIPIFVRALASGEAPVIHGDGLQTRDFVHVSDAVAAALAAAACPGPAEDVFNVATGRSASILEVLGILGTFFPGGPAPVHAPARIGDPPFSEAAVGRARDFLGFTARTGLREGLAGLLGARWPGPCPPA